MSDPEQDLELFLQRPVSLDALARLRALCTNDQCRQIECAALKAALAALDDVLRWT